MHKLHELYRVEQLPIFQNRMYHTALEGRNCPKGDMQLVEDLTTGLVYNAAFRPELMVYDKHYQNEQAVSPLFQQHLDTVASIIDQRMGKERVVEVGCGKGHFLETLLAKGFDVTGFDPTYEGGNPRVKRQYFAPGVIEKANGLILRHVLEHIQNPVGFLKGLYSPFSKSALDTQLKQFLILIQQSRGNSFLAPVCPSSRRHKALQNFKAARLFMS